MACLTLTSKIFYYLVVLQHYWYMIYHDVDIWCYLLCLTISTSSHGK